MSGEGCQVNVYRPCETGISKRANPPHLFSGILRALVVSCPPFSIAPVTSVCERKTQTCRRTSMPKHVSIPPGRNKHAKTCQNMAVERLKLFQNSNLPKHVSRPPVRSVWANSTNTEHYIACQKCLSKHDKKHSSALLEAFSYTRHAKTCQDTICQTCQNMSGYHLSNMPKHVRIPSIKHVWVKSKQTWQ